MLEQGRRSLITGALIVMAGSRTLQHSTATYHVFPRVSNSHFWGPCGVKARIAVRVFPHHTLPTSALCPQLPPPATLINLNAALRREFVSRPGRQVIAIIADGLSPT